MYAYTQWEMDGTRIFQQTKLTCPWKQTCALAFACFDTDGVQQQQKKCSRFDLILNGYKFESNFSGAAFKTGRNHTRTCR